MDIIHEHAPLVYLDRDEIVIDGKPNRFVSRCPIAFAATKHPLDLILAGRADLDFTFERTTRANRFMTCAARARARSACDGVKKSGHNPINRRRICPFQWFDKWSP